MTTIFIRNAYPLHVDERTALVNAVSAAHGVQIHLWPEPPTVYLCYLIGYPTKRQVTEVGRTLHAVHEMYWQCAVKAGIFQPGRVEVIVSEDRPAWAPELVVPA